MTFWDCVWCVSLCVSVYSPVGGGAQSIQWYKGADELIPVS